MTMQFKTNRAALLAALAILALPTAANAGAHRVRPSEAEPMLVGDYVQDGLFLHYDGRANGGVNGDGTANHVSSTQEWANLGSGGAGYDLGRDPTVTDTSYPKADKWFDTYRMFDLATGRDYDRFQVQSPLTLGTNFTMQAAVDANAEDNYRTDAEWIFYPRSEPSSVVDRLLLGITAKAHNSNLYPKHSFYFRQTEQLGSKGYTYFLNDPVTYTYATAIRNGNKAMLFEGTDIPTAGSGFYQTNDFANANKEYVLQYPLVGFGWRGKIYNVRYYYDKVLSEDELKWNRLVDQARIYGELTTNVVVRVAPAPGETAYSEEEYYAVDHDGATFAAPASTTGTYYLGGYTVETWDGSGWSAEEVHEGMSLAVAFAPESKIRLTWQWRVPGAHRIYPDSAEPMLVSDYVQDGLYLHYDGIRNQGANEAHSSTATTWVNLGSGGTGYNLSKATAAAATEGPGEWRDDGYYFNGYLSYTGFSVSKRIEVEPDFTSQALLDAKPGDQTTNGVKVTAYVFCPTDALVDKSTDSLYTDGEHGAWKYWSMQIRGSDNRISPVAFQQKKQYASLYGSADVAFTDVTEMMDGGTNVVVFSGTEPPWDDTPKTSGAASRRQVANAGYEFENQSFIVRDFRIGNGNGSKEGMKGTVKSFRHYNGKKLTVDELKWNRLVDDARFNGAVTTNIVVRVAPAPGGTEYSEEEMYAVDPAGATFTAPAGTVVFNGQDFVAKAYTLETWTGEGWGEAETFYGTSFTAAFDPEAKVRLTWKWRAVAWRSAGEYDVGDYVQDGLVLHYDGIRNAGADAAHDGAALSWANLGSGAGFDLERWSHNTLTTNEAGEIVGEWLHGDGTQGAWTDRGFAFAHFSLFGTATPLAVSNYTIQVLGDAHVDAQQYENFTTNALRRSTNTGYVFFGTNKDGEEDLDVARRWTRLGVALRHDMPNGGVTGGGEPAHRGTYALADYFLGKTDRDSARATVTNDTLRYFTAVLDIESAERASLAATEGVTFTNTLYAYFENSASAEPGLNGNVYGGAPWHTSGELSYGFTLGGQSSPDLLYDGQNLTGELKNIRYYDRVLGESELVRNRQVDDARFFGVTPTNVVVRSSSDFLRGNEEEGAYALSPDGYTFSAPARVEYGGKTYLCTGYTVERWNFDLDDWGESETVRGATSVSAAAGDAMRITWQWASSNGIVIGVE